MYRHFVRCFCDPVVFVADGFVDNDICILFVACVLHPPSIIITTTTAASMHFVVDVLLLVIAIADGVLPLLPILCRLLPLIFFLFFLLHPSHRCHYLSCFCVFTSTAADNDDVVDYNIMIMNK